MKHYPSFIIGLLVLLGLAASAKATSAAVLFGSPQEVTVVAGTTFPVSIVLESEGEVINAVELVVRYPSETVEALSVVRGRSFLKLWAEEPRIDKSGGTVTLVGGIPNGTVAFNAEVVTILFLARSGDQTSIEVDIEKSTVALNDGLGTPALLTAHPTGIVITEPDPLAPLIESPTHPDEAEWYPDRDVLVQWHLRPESLYSFQLSRESIADPDDTPDEHQEGKARFPSLTDGIWFFNLKEKLGADPWGPVGRRRFMIDGTPPEDLFVNLIREEVSGRWLVVFAGQDAGSGIDHYEVRILRPRHSWFPFSFQGQWQRAENPLALEEHPVISAIHVRAYDLADNVQEASTAGPSLQPLRNRFVVMVALAVLLLAIIVLMVFKRKRESRKKL